MTSSRRRFEESCALTFGVKPLSLGAPWPWRHEDPFKLCGHHSAQTQYHLYGDKSSATPLWYTLISDISVSVTLARIRNKYREIWIKLYASAFVQKVTGMNLDVLPTALIDFCNFLCHCRHQLPYHSTLYGMSYWKKIELTTIPNSNRVPLMVRHNKYKAFCCN
jgi:hypothetical protein